MLFKIYLLFVWLLLFQAVLASDDEVYEPVKGMCSTEMCSCTSTDGALRNGDKGKLFTIDCIGRNLQHLFAGWPEQMGDNHTGIEVTFFMSSNELHRLQQLPFSEARIFFSCRHCQITEIASRAFIDTLNIITLDLAYNKIESSDLFADIFRGIESDDEYAPIKLETLDLSHNNIKYLEKLIFEHTPRLRSLDLSYNPITTFDEPTEAAFGYLKELEILDLSHTGLMDLPSKIIEKTSKLQEIYLNGNQFLTVPESLSSLGETLKFLHLSGNPIEVIDDESFAGLIKLEQLNISAMMQLREIRHDSLRHLTSLEVLHCRGNPKLSNFHMENLRELRHLKELDISRNNLTTLNFGIVDMEDVESIETIDYKKYEDQFKKLRILKLAGNPWKCDCPMIRALSVFNHDASYFTKNANEDNAKCGSPSGLTTKLLYDLPTEFMCNNKAQQRELKIPIYDPPQFLRPKSIMLTVISVVGVVVFGIFLGFCIVCIKRRMKPETSNGYTSSPIRYTTVRDSTMSNGNGTNLHYNP